MNAKLIARVALTVIFHGWVVSSAGAQGVGSMMQFSRCRA